VLHLEPAAKQQFHPLSREKEQIEKEIAARLEWREKPEIGNSEIILKLHDADPENRHDWPRQHAWLLKHLEAFYMAFAPRI
jgi:hypothetical protein